jgi:hypothetical protein
MRNRKRFAAHIAGVAVILAVLVYAGRPSPHVPPYDANLVRLAETERQGYCAGVTFWKTQAAGSAEQARACRIEHTEQSGRVNMTATERGFCQGIVDSGWIDGFVADCVSILRTYQLWPTYDGSITDQWNRARPYPSTSLGGAGEESDGSRTGGRSGGPGHSSSSRGADYDYYPGGTP